MESTVLRKAEDLVSVKLFFFILWKYSHFHIPEKINFLPEMGANSLSRFSALTLQDNSLPQISLPASEGHAGRVRSGFICLRLSYQNYTVAIEVQPAVTNTHKQAPLPAAALSLWTMCLHSRSRQRVSWPLHLRLGPSWQPPPPASPCAPWLCPPCCLGFRWFCDTCLKEV